MAASNNGQREAVDQLLQYKANPNMRDHVSLVSLLPVSFRIPSIIGWLVCPPGLSVQESRENYSKSDRGRS